MFTEEHSRYCTVNEPPLMERARCCVAAFMAECTPLPDPSAVNWGPVRISLLADAYRGVSLETIFLPLEKRGQGHGGSALLHLCVLADQFGVPIVLNASPIDGSRDIRRLIRFYNRFGFELLHFRDPECAEMKREPLQPGQMTSSAARPLAEQAARAQTPAAYPPPHPAL